MKNIFYVYKNKYINNNIHLLASYPRSGNTWMRHIISHIYSSLWDNDYDKHLNYHPDKIIPNGDKKDSIGNCVTWAKKKLIIKTHHDYQTTKKIYGNNCKYVHLIRRPEDALTSYYYYHLRYDHLKQFASNGIDKFVLENLDEWIKHTNGYYEHKIKSKIIHIKYENMIADPFTEIMKLMNYLNISCDDVVINNAIQLCNFKLLQAKEKENNFRDVLFFRNGKAGSGEKELSTETLNIIYDKMKNLNIYDRKNTI